ncbi:pneumococcal-type histidine triad protein [Facklamia miroungae]|uniref:Histidine triad protein n=1 Tax=Facklamia miroungae TaxID=120956 RepID=A0A1G7TAK8_9LACT|nr:pneumococcal-type histidine triad protein [Facklamia miroungae]NKZ29740.1 pneumococcal-type histidine triad protein [Facklamia miroungae]SDG32336.1 histidine triad protein [Facklamia miroungae]
MKRSKLLLSSAALLTFLSLNGPIHSIKAQDTKDSAINYIEGGEETNQDTQSSIESRTMEEISMEEGIAGEQIIVQINSEGYVTSHGDHYHYFNGEVPADAIFSEAVLAPSDYQFKQEDLISETDEGKIVLFNDQYYLYLENIDQAKNLRHLEEVLLQSYGMDPSDARAIYDLIEEYKLGEDAIITYELERSPQEVADAKGIEGEHVVVYLTEEEFVTNHAFDLHVFYGQVDPEATFSEKLLTPEDYQLNQEDIIAEIKNGYIVKVEDQFMVYIAPEDRDQADNIRSFEEIEEQAASSHQLFKQTGGVRKDQSNTVAPGEVGGSGSRNANGAYVTDDGYVFSPYDVIQDLGNGFIVPHGDHFHFIPKSDLTPQELAIAHSVLSGTGSNKKNGTVGQNEKMDSILHDKPINHEGPYTTDDGYVFSVESITKVTQTGLIAAHGSHFHFVPFAHLNKGELAQTQAYIQQKFGIKRNLLAEFGLANDKNHSDHLDNKQPEKNEDSSSVKPKPGKPEVKTEYQRLLAKLYALPANQRHTESDGLVFDPELVTDEIDGDFVMPHGDHFHVIPRSSLSELEIKLAEMKLGKSHSGDNKPQKPEDSHPSQPKPDQPGHEEPADPEKPSQPDQEEPADPEKPSQPEKPNQPESPDQSVTKEKVDFLAKNYKKSAKGKDGKAYTTDDGYIFTPESILNYSEKGLTAEHEGHTHFIPFGDLEDSELKAAADFINNRQIEEAEESKYTQAEIDAKLAYVSLENGVAIEDLEINGNEVIIPHGNHSHTANLDKIPTELNRQAYASDEEYQTKLITLKMSEVSRNKKYIDVWRKDATIYALTTDYQVEELPLDTVELPIKYDKVSLKDVKTGEDPLFEKKVYVAKKYKVKPSDMFIYNGRIKVGDFNLVIDEIDVTEPIEADDTSSDADEEPIEDEKPVKEDTDRQAVINFIKNYYGPAVKSVNYGKGFGYIVSPAAGGDNILISEAQAKQAMEANGTLPELDAWSIEEESYAVKRTSSERTTNKKSSLGKQTNKKAVSPKPAAKKPLAKKPAIDHEVIKNTEGKKSDKHKAISQPTNDQLKHFVANYYGVNPVSVQIFAGKVIVSNPNPAFENLVIAQQLVIAAYNGQSTLPAMPQTQPFVEENSMEEVSKEAENEPASTFENSEEVNEPIETTSVLETELSHP